MVPHGLPRVRIAQVHLDDRMVIGLQRIVEGQRGVRIGPGIDDRPDGGVPRLVHGIDETALMVALDAGGGQARLGGGGGAHRLDVGQSGAAVDLGLTLAEEVEVRAVEDKDLRHGHLGNRAAMAAAVSVRWGTSATSSSRLRRKTGAASASDASSLRSEERRVGKGSGSLRVRNQRAEKISRNIR